jgi:hypothetical protein
VKTKALQAIGITNANTWPVPAKSPDFQKVIEHVFGIMSNRFQDKLYSTDYEELHKAADYKRCVESMFYHELTKNSVQKVGASLKDLYAVVMKPESEGGVAGGWPPDKYT